MSFRLTVIICTHNPRLEYLERSLQALRTQELSKDQWELIIVDNASQTPVKERIDIEWHPHARVVLEDALGLTRARERGITEADSNLLCFIDDDNIPDPSYLRNALLIAEQRSDLGAWGGEIHPEYEVRPAPALEKYTSLLAIHSVPRNLWANFPQGVCLPRGAGLIVRERVCQQYQRKLSQCQLRKGLGRSGVQLTSCEDTDLCYCAFDIGLGVGVFRELQLTHIIPKERVTINYLLRAEEAMSYSWAILDYLHDKPNVANRTQLLQRVASVIRWLPLSSVDKRFYAASQAGKRRAQQFLRNSKQKV
jgi:glycosyltransferase involved in cell wall biosynthesis